MKLNNIVRKLTLFTIITLGTMSMSQAQEIEIRIDEGTVNVEFVELPANQTYDLQLHAQGECQPEIAIEKRNALINVTHTKSCHGNGYREGSIFSLKLSKNASHNLSLNAGTINISGKQLDQLCSEFTARVMVGGIRQEVEIEHLFVERKMVVGAQANYNKPAAARAQPDSKINESVMKDAEPTSAVNTRLQLQVRYGDVRIQ
ncbi:MAG: hypothetical protein HY253_00390 [Burkholderiales bacterium]|nr:hypothetical protein [Burkholderiales bacterium]